MTPADLKARREAMGLTQEHLAQQFGVAHNTVARWEQGVNPIPRVAELALERLELMADQIRGAIRAGG